MEWIIIGLIVSLTIGIFYAGWQLGGNSREDKIKLGALNDIQEHYQKMVGNFKEVDDLVDNAKSVLRVRDTDKDRNPTILAAIRAKRSKKPEKEST